MNRLDDNDALDQLYAQSANEKPPEHLDQKVLAEARANSSVNGSRSTFTWQRVLSVAAVMVLSISIFFDVDGNRQSELGTPALLPQSERVSAPVSTDEKQASGSEARSDRAKEESKKRQQIQHKAAKKSTAKQAVQYAAEAEVISEQDTGEQALMKDEAMAPQAISSQSIESVENSPQQMLKSIQRLLERGDMKQAKALYNELEQTYPDYPVPALVRQKLGVE